MSDEHYLRLALEQAAMAEALGEVPIGAILVANGEIIASAPAMTSSNGESAADAEF